MFAEHRFEACIHFAELNAVDESEESMFAIFGAAHVCALQTV